MSLLLCTAMAVQLSTAMNHTVQYGGVGIPPKPVVVGSLQYGGVGIPPRETTGSSLQYGGVGIPPAVQYGGVGIPPR